MRIQGFLLAELWSSSHPVSVFLGKEKVFSFSLAELVQGQEKLLWSWAAPEDTLVRCESSPFRPPGFILKSVLSLGFTLL